MEGAQGRGQGEMREGKGDHSLLPQAPSPAFLGFGVGVGMRVGWDLPPESHQPCRRGGCCKVWASQP